MLYLAQPDSRLSVKIRPQGQVFCLGPLRIILSGQPEPSGFLIWNLQSSGSVSISLALPRGIVVRVLLASVWMVSSLEIKGPTVVPHGPSLKGHSRVDTHVERSLFLGRKCSEYMWCSLSSKCTSLIRTELLGSRGVLIRGGLLYWCLLKENRVIS